MRCVCAALRKEKDVHAATCAQLESCKAKLSEVQGAAVRIDGNATEKEQQGASLDIGGEGI